MAAFLNPADGNRRAIADIFGGYKIDFMHELGRGGFGTVYKGWDSNNLSVAVKKITRDAGPRAHKEALSLQQLKDQVAHHPNIISIYDIKYWNGAIWIPMQLCNEGDLDQYFKNKFETAEKISTKLIIMLGVSNGLEFLHAQQIVHRDIKPANILVASSSAGITAKIADFGLCKILEPDQSTMSSNVGTLVFKAPEFWDPKSDERIRYNRTVDVYAAGLTFAAILQAVKGRSLIPKVRMRGHLVTLLKRKVSIPQNQNGGSCRTNLFGLNHLFSY